MEIVKYICEFFFGNFWHWLGLMLLIGEITLFPVIKVIYRDKTEK